MEFTALAIRATGGRLPCSCEWFSNNSTQYYNSFCQKYQKKSKKITSLNIAGKKTLQAQPVHYALHTWYN
jgi:hypothetical protein